MATIFDLPEHLLTSILCSWMDVSNLCRLDTACTSRSIRPKYLACIVQDINLYKVPRCFVHGQRSFYSLYNCREGCFAILDWFATHAPKSPTRLPLAITINCGYTFKCKDEEFIARKRKEGVVYTRSINLYLEISSNKITPVKDIVSTIVTLFPRIANLHVKYQCISSEELAAFLKAMVSHYDAFSQSLKYLYLTVYSQEYALSETPEGNAVVDSFFHLYGKHIAYLENTLFNRSVDYILEYCPNIQFLISNEFSPGCWDNVNKVTKIKEIRHQYKACNFLIPIDKIKYFPDLEEYIFDRKGDESGGNIAALIEYFLVMLKTCPNIKCIDLSGISWNSSTSPEFLLNTWNFSKNTVAMTNLLELLSLIPALKVARFDTIHCRDVKYAMEILKQSRQGASVEVVEIETCEGAVSVVPFVTILRNLPGIRRIKIGEMKWTIGGYDEGMSEFITEADEDHPNPQMDGSVIVINDDTLFLEESSKRDFEEFAALIPPIHTFDVDFMNHLVMETIQQGDAFRHVGVMKLDTNQTYITAPDALELFHSSLQNSDRLHLFSTCFFQWKKTVKSPSDVETMTVECYSELTLLDTFFLSLSSAPIFTQAMALVPAIRNLYFDQNESDILKYYTALNYALTSTGHSSHVRGLFVQYSGVKLVQHLKSTFPALKVFITNEINESDHPALYLKELVQNYPSLEHIMFQVGEWSKHTTKEVIHNGDIAEVHYSYSTLKLHRNFSLQNAVEKEDFIVFLQNIPFVIDLDFPNGDTFDDTTRDNLVGAFSSTQNADSLEKLITNKIYVES